MTRARPFLFPLGASFGADNLILHASARRHTVDNYPGPLSIKTVLRGTATWTAGGRAFPVDQESFLVLNDGEPYSLHIDSPVPVATCCAFFQRGFVEGVARDISSSLKIALDAPADAAPALPFLSRLHSGGALLQRVQSLAPRCSEHLQPSGFEEDFVVIASDLAGLYREIQARIARVPAARPATREELFRRVERGREFLHSQTGGPVSLRQAAREACVSPYHFHRAFTAAYQETPHAYLTRIRLTQARRQLASGRSVLETAIDAGFSGAPAFSRLFRTHFGVNPSGIRKIG